MPLAHILAPQLARKAEEIAAALGHPSPTSAGYLRGVTPEARPYVQQYQAGDAAFGDAGGRAYAAGIDEGAARGREASTQNFKRRLSGASSPETAFAGAGSYLQSIGAGTAKPLDYDPRTPIGGAIEASRGMPGPMARAFLGILDQPARTQITPMPNAKPDAPPPLDTSKIAKKGTPMVIKLGEGEVGMDEAGRAVDKKGKKTGFLVAQTQPGRSLEIRREDVTPGFNPLARSAFGAAVLNDLSKKAMKAYGDEYEAYKYNGYKWPKGYFDGWDPKEAKAARQTVENIVATATDVGPDKKPVVY